MALMRKLRRVPTATAVGTLVARMGSSLVAGCYPRPA